MDAQEFEGRKKSHLEQAMKAENQAKGLSGLDHIHLVHEALPNLNFDKISLKSTCLGKATQTPFFISGMTAGHVGAVDLNKIFARVCQKRGWALGVGSQRREFESEKTSAWDDWKRIRRENPDLLLFGNLGIAQLIQAGETQLHRLVDSLEAQALVIHCNALQEVLQPEGTPHFEGAWGALEKAIKILNVPVVIKETGCGFSESTLHRLAELELGAVDLGGLGGTHWGRIEGARNRHGVIRERVAITFQNWGESTLNSAVAASKILTRMEIWGSGGLRSGLDAAKLIAIGANRVGYAQPALEAALQGENALEDWMELQEFELKTALFCTGFGSVTDLRGKDEAWNIKER